ncbi:MAG: hypothetical protein RMI94_03255 [Bryobacterales bacterium]|nr:outer membrane lipoprotein-sorting protein [Bryobacteraceae bacterium]MDW8129540.1 hypothetical protein [Bryobacterales bacterium]
MVVAPTVLLSVGLFQAPPQGDPTEAEIQAIIEKFAAKESEFARARENYTYRQMVRIEELDEGGNVRGRFEVVSDIILSPEGRRTERVVRAPVPTLKRIQLTPEDEQDIRNVQPFVLTKEDIGKYWVRYLGRQQVDEITCYVFAVKPKKMEPGQRYFQGLIWVDDQDLQIVKTYGRGVGLLKKGYDNQFPKFETYRAQIDGKYWFPVWTNADDTLYFETGPQRIRMRIRYEDYKQFKADVQIRYGEPVQTPPQPPQPQPKRP